MGAESQTGVLVVVVLELELRVEEPCQGQGELRGEEEVSRGLGLEEVGLLRIDSEELVGRQVVASGMVG